VLIPDLEMTTGINAAQPQQALAELAHWQQQNPGARLAGWPEFQGGLILLISYDLVRAYEPISAQAKDDLGTLPIIAGFAREVLVYDHQEKSVTAIVLGDRLVAPSLEELHEACLGRARKLLAKWLACPRQSEKAPVHPQASQPALSRLAPVATFDEVSFCSAVRRVQEYIAAGDTYQVNLSLRQSFPLTVDPEQIYETLRRINPSPYMGLLRTPGLTLVSGSPELLVRTCGDRLESRPIAGTRPRGNDPAADLALLQELLANEKERAEHLMLVDLLRNDLGRVARRGSVGVDEFMTVESYSHVMHLVSHISGHLETMPAIDDVLRAVFPGGTITGAPKVRTMQIIEELEPVRRGYYTGAFGWLGLDGSLNLNIIIRSLIAQNGVGHIQAGAGIVADSDPAREYRESLNKALALVRALEETKYERRLA
jgi:para-aminobenzoate synthetase component 1